MAANFRRLDGKSYDPDALKHLTEMLLAVGRAQDALDLLWHFWPILRRDRGLMGWVVPEAAGAIIELRIGLLRSDPAHGANPTKALVRQVADGLGPSVDLTMVAGSIGIMWGRREEPPWSKSDFEYPRARRRPQNPWEEEEEEDAGRTTAGRWKKSPFPELEVEPLWLAARFAAAESVRLAQNHSDTALYDTEMSLWALSEWPRISDDGPWDSVPGTRCLGILSPLHLKQYQRNKMRKRTETIYPGTVLNEAPER